MLKRERTARSLSEIEVLRDSMSKLRRREGESCVFVECHRYAALDIRMTSLTEVTDKKI